MGREIEIYREATSTALAGIGSLVGSMPRGERGDLSFLLAYLFIIVFFIVLSTFVLTHFAEALVCLGTSLAKSYWKRRRKESEPKS